MDDDLHYKNGDSEMKEINQRGISPEEKVKEQNRIRQLAFKARSSMPKDYKSFCLVAAHFIKNAHRYWNIEPEKAKQMKIEAEEVSKTENTQVSEAVLLVNKQLREIRTLKRQNRIHEQQCLVEKLKRDHGSYWQIAKLTSIPLKTVHEWCAEPKERQHKSTSRAQL